MGGEHEWLASTFSLILDVEGWIANLKIHGEVVNRF